jgi:hypothetical protein
VPGRRFLAIVASIFFLAALVALVLWVGSRSDTTLARWSAISTVFSAVITVLALAAAVVPLLRHDGGSGQATEQHETVVNQKISGKNVYAAGRDQIITNYPKRDNEE